MIIVKFLKKECPCGIITVYANIVIFFERSAVMSTDGNYRSRFMSYLIIRVAHTVRPA